VRLTMEHIAVNFAKEGERGEQMTKTFLGFVGEEFKKRFEERGWRYVYLILNWKGKRERLTSVGGSLIFWIRITNTGVFRGFRCRRLIVRLLRSGRKIRKVQRGIRTSDSDWEGNGGRVLFSLVEGARG